jgi:hypothetical protein
METTRKFPRTLAEAFPRDARHAYAIERVYSRRYECLLDVALACVLGITFGLMVAFSL